MKLIVGLGNPGKEYENTRHNCGFLVMDRLAKQCDLTLTKKKWNALIEKKTINGVQVLFMKPLTYMNESGLAVIQAVNYYNIEPEDILVIHDDMDLEVGAVRIREKGSSGGQKGMNSIINQLGTSQFPRIRVGVGHSTRGQHDKVPDWVLSPVPKEEKKDFEEALDIAAKAAYAWIDRPIEEVLRYNKKVVRKKDEETE